jgi:ABC-type Fe3+-hydroxamate transport system substrate-binding protein
VLSPCGADLDSGVQQAAELAALPGWWAVPAVRTGRVFVVDHSLFSRPGPRSAAPPQWILVAFPTNRCKLDGVVEKPC